MPTRGAQVVQLRFAVVVRRQSRFEDFACKGRARFAGRIRGKHSVDCVVCGRGKIMTGNRSKVDDAVELWIRW